MATQTPSTLVGEIQAIAAHLEQTWNRADGVAFAEPFANDADFVNVYGTYGHGREAIAQAHAHIFSTVYAGSRVSYQIDRARLLRDDVAIAHVRGNLKVPQGPMAGSHDAFASMVLTRESSGWTIAAFHNTFVRPPAF